MAPSEIDHEFKKRQLVGEGELRIQSLEHINHVVVILHREVHQYVECRGILANHDLFLSDHLPRALILFISKKII